VSETAAWKMLHALMAVHQNLIPLLKGIVEADEKYPGASPCFNRELTQTGHGTMNAGLTKAVQRQGRIKIRLVTSNGVAELKPFVERAVDQSAHPMGDAPCLSDDRPRFSALNNVQHGQK